MTRDNFIRFVQTTFPLGSIKAEQIVANFQPREVSKHDFILKEGSVCRESYFLDTGLMRAYTYDLAGNDVTTAFFSGPTFANDLFSFFKQVPASENIQALTDCTAWYITYEDMQESFHTIPEFREFGRLNIINQYGQLKQRMLSMLQESAEQRYAHLIRSNPEILQNAPLKNIASYLGITDTSLSRIRKDFVKNKV